MIRYAVMVGEEKGGEVHHLITRDEVTLTLRSLLVTRDGETWEDSGVVMDSQTLRPLSSRKNIPYPAAGGVLELDTRYQEHAASIRLRSPAGTKEASIPLIGPTYDLEQIPLLFSLLDPTAIESLNVSILVPISGMVWRGRLRRVSEDTESIRFRFTLAGEVLYFRFSREAPYLPLEIEAPHRGYVLRKVEGRL
ncbi:MAG TPA: hypothetical protein VLH40_01125 [Atribacteraceae bacterium]|nr:hypothetical protein [Atribacteraceae bacterium]